MISLQDVSKQYGSKNALFSCDLNILGGHTTVLIGPSGCGKSTILKLIAGLTQPSTGKILFDSIPLSESNLTRFRHRMGYVIQEGGLFPHLTVRDNTILMAQHLGWESTRIATRLVELAGMVKLTPEFLDRYPTELSGGQRQRVSIMRALMVDPDLILLDEPLGALDPINRYDLQIELKSIFRQLGKTVVMVTHDLAEAGFFADHVVLMRDGGILQQGSFQEILNKPANPFVKRFVNAQKAQLKVYMG